jgi:hypothetical protein
VDPAELSPGEFVARVRRAVEADHAKVIVIDSLNGYMHAMPDERFLTAQLHELLTYLGRQGVTTLMVVAQHGMLGTHMVAPVDTSYLADSVVLLRYFEYAGHPRAAVWSRWNIPERTVGPVPGDSDRCPRRSAQDRHVGVYSRERGWLASLRQIHRSGC